MIPAVVKDILYPYMSVRTDAKIGPKIAPKPNPPVFIAEIIACSFYFSLSLTGLCSWFSIAMVSVCSIAGVELLLMRAPPTPPRAIPKHSVTSLLEKMLKLKRFLLTLVARKQGLRGAYWQ